MVQTRLVLIGHHNRDMSRAELAIIKNKEKMGQAIYHVVKFDELYSKQGRGVRTCD